MTSYLSSSKMFTSLESLPSKTSNSSLLTLEDYSDLVQLFHNRFSHVSPRLVSKIKTFDDMPSHLKTKSSSIMKERCEVYMSCKQVEYINRGPREKMNKTLWLIHSDSWGRCRVMGTEGNFYFVSFTDDFSPHSGVYTMNSLTEVPHLFKLYKESKELQTGLKIKAM